MQCMSSHAVHERKMFPRLRDLTSDSLWTGRGRGLGKAHFRFREIRVLLILYERAALLVLLLQVLPWRGLPYRPTWTGFDSLHPPNALTTLSGLYNSIHATEERIRPLPSLVVVGALVCHLVCLRGAWSVEGGPWGITLFYTS